MLTVLEKIVSASTTREVWNAYLARMAELGFPAVCYFALRLLETPEERLINDRIFLSSYPSRLRSELRKHGPLAEGLPVYRWLCGSSGGSVISWTWMDSERAAGRMSPSEDHILGKMHEYGYKAGYGISLQNIVSQVSAGLILSGAPNMSQTKLDTLWQRNGREAQALSKLAHLRLSSLPYDTTSDVLTPRQREVLEALSIGRTVSEVADQLEIAPTTIEKHLRLARRALGARTTAQAILLASMRHHIFAQGQISTQPATAWVT